MSDKTQYILFSDAGYSICFRTDFFDFEGIGHMRRDKLETHDPVEQNLFFSSLTLSTSTILLLTFQIIFVSPCASSYTWQPVFESFKSW